MPKQAKVVEKATKDFGICEVCGKPIVKGEPYQWLSYKSHDVSHHVGCDYTEEQLMTREERAAVKNVAKAVDQTKVEVAKVTAQIEPETPKVPELTAEGAMAELASIVNEGAVDETVHPLG